jgi:hypothetical protein
MENYITQCLFNFNLKLTEEDKMKYDIMKKLLLIAAVTFIFGSSSALAGEDSPTASASAAFLSEYVWRGYELSKDSMVIQPSMTIGYKGFAFNAWSNLDTDAGGSADLNETDLTTSYDTKAGSFGLGAGYIYYGLAGNDTQEFYVKASYDTLLAPTLIIYKDINSFPGYYINLGLSHSINLTDAIALNLSSGFGYYISQTDSIVEAGTNNRYNGLQDGLISAGLSIPVGKYITVAPALSYSFALSDKAKALLGNSSSMYGGVVFSFSF